MTRKQIWTRISRARFSSKYGPWGLCQALENVYYSTNMTPLQYNNERMRLLRHEPPKAAQWPHYPYWWPRNAEGNKERRRVARQLAKGR